MAEKPLTEPVEGSPAELSGEAVESEPELQSQEQEPQESGLQRERDELYERLLRKTAEFDNYRKRIERERREQTEQGIANLLLELLLVVDDFDRAVDADAGTDASSLAYRKGVELIHSKLNDVLRKHGVRPIDTAGADFDPTLHQAVVHEHSAGHREGEVISELRRGYLIGDRLLRPALVKVAKA